MLQNIDLRELAEMRGNGRDFVSAYFCGEEGLDALAARERSLRDLLADNQTELELFDENMKLIRGVLEEHSVERAESVCMFACALLDFVRGYPISMPVPTEMHVGAAPYIRPLAELQDEYETFALVSCDNDKTRIFLVTNETANVEATVRGGVKNHVRKGGWSQQRYERRRENALNNYAKDVGEALSGLQKQRDFQRVVLIGSSETMQEIESELPQHLADLVVAKDPFDLGRGQDALIEQAYEEYFAEERQDERNLWQRIKDEYMSHGRGAVGGTAVLEAALAGRVDTMIVTRDARITGTQCRKCEHLVHGTPQTCQLCGFSSVFEVDLVDALTRQVELTSGQVDYVDEMPGLTKVGHVAAFLRY
ncbi:MAG: Vms1/Ankzf1 family peptidyl-tRNA hydrolase [Pirellulales bacterium]